MNLFFHLDRGPIRWAVVGVFVCLLLGLRDALADQLAEIKLAGGQIIPARVTGLQNQRWQITSPLFEGDAQVNASGVQSVRFGDALVDEKHDAPLFRVDCINGDTVVGEIVAWDQDRLSLKQFDLGEISLPCNRLMRVTRVSDSVQWVTAAQMPIDGSSAVASKQGEIRFHQGGKLVCPMGLEADSELTFTFRLNADTEFQILLKVEKETVTKIQISLDGILSEMEDSLEFGDIEFHSGIEQLSLSVADGHLLIRDRLGKQILRQAFSFQVAPTIQIQNDGEQLDVLSVCGDVPRSPAQLDDEGSANMVIVEGSGVSYFENRVTVQGDMLELGTEDQSRSIPLDSVQAICFTAAKTAPAVKSGAVVLWADGSRLSAHDMTIHDSMMSFENESLKQDGALQAAHPRAVFFPKSKEERKQGGQKLVLSGSSYQGEFRWGPNGTLDWQFDEFDNAVALSSQRKLSITGFVDSDTLVPADLDRLLLANGTLLPCRILLIDEKGISISSPFCDATTIPLEQFRACFFACHDADRASAITQESIRRALLVPRFARDLEPSHVLIATNGDLLRGGLVSLNEKIVGFDSRAELLRIERDRIGAIVGLKQGTDSQTEIAQETTIDYGNEFVMVGRIQESEDSLIMDVPGCGRCKLPKLGVRTIRRNAGQSDLSAFYRYTAWETTAAIDPRWKEPAAPDSNADEMVGKKAPEIELTTVKGDMFRLSDHLGKVVILDFWATWCKPCVMGMPGYMEMMKGLSSEEVTFMPLNLGEPASTVERFLRAKDWDLAVALDTQNRVATEYNVSAVPHLVIIDQKGIVKHVKIGYSPGSATDVMKYVKEMLK